MMRKMSFKNLLGYQEDLIGRPIEFKIETNGNSEFTYTSRISKVKADDSMMMLWLSDEETRCLDLSEEWQKCAKIPFVLIETNSEIAWSDDDRINISCYIEEIDQRVACIIAPLAT